MQTDYKTKTTDYEKQINSIRLSNAIKLELGGKAHDLDFPVARLIDANKIKLDDSGKIQKGFAEQLQDLQKNKSFLFVPEQTTQQEQPLFKGATPANSQRDNSGGSDPFISGFKSEY